MLERIAKFPFFLRLNNNLLNIPHIPLLGSFCPVFSCNGFIVLGLTCRSLTLFELIFEYVVSKHQLHSFACGDAIFSLLVEMTTLFPLKNLRMFVKNNFTM